MLLRLAAVSLILIVPAVSSATITCDSKSKQRMDTYASRMITITESTRLFPETEREYRRYCTESLQYLDYVNKYNNKCLKSFAKKAANVLFFPIHNQFKLLCKSGRMPKRARELLAAAPCANKAKKGMQKCAHDFIEAYMGIADFAKDSLKIPLGCCNYYKLKDCLKTEAEEEKTCTRSTVDYVERYTDDLFAGILQLLCYDWEEGSDKCSKIIDQTPKKDPNKPRTKTFIPPAIDILENIKDEYGGK